MQSTERKYLLAILSLLIIPISGVAIDIYVPSLPAVSQHFGVHKSLAQLTITTYMLGFGVMQLFAGSISDSFGRKKPFIIGMLIFIIVTLLVPWSHNIYQLLVYRLIQGIAVGLTIVPMRSIIPDLFHGRELQKMMNYMTIAWSIGPIIAPGIGGYLQHYFNWHANFYFLGVYSIIIFTFTLIYLPETSQHVHPFHPIEIIKRYFHILFHWRFASGVIINGFIYSFLILFNIVAPFLIQNVLHYSAIHFGQIALLMGFCWFLGTMTNRFLLDIELEVKAKVCFWFMFIITLVFTFFAFTRPMTLYTIVIPSAILFWMSGLIFPNYFSRSILLFPNTIGSANALFGAFVFFIAGLSSALATFLKANNARPLGIAYVVLMSLCLIVYYLDIRKKE